MRWQSFCIVSVVVVESVDFCSGSHNQCCDFYGAGVVFKVKLPDGTLIDQTCATYVKGGDYNFCASDKLQLSNVAVKEVCRKTCNYCDEVLNDIPSSALVSVYGSCKTYAGTGPNAGFCDIDPPDLFLNSMVSVFHLCKQTCAADSANNLFAVKAKERERIQLGQLTCDPAGTECCDYYPIGQPVTANGASCADYVNVHNIGVPNRGTNTAYLYPFCATAVVTEALTRPDGTQDTQHKGKLVQDVCRLSCQTCSTRCDSQNKCCDFYDNQAVSGNRKCKDYREGTALFPFCWFDRAQKQFSVTDVKVAQMCMRSCGCCYDEYAAQEYVTGEGGCEKYSKHLPSFGVNTACIGVGVNTTFPGGNTRDRCAAYCQRRLDGSVPGGSCQGYEWDPTDKTCLIFASIRTAPFYTPITSGPKAANQVQCFRKSGVSQYCDTDLVISGPWANSGKVVSDVCRYSCGKCSPLYDDKLPVPDGARTYVPTPLPTSSPTRPTRQPTPIPG